MQFKFTLIFTILATLALSAQAAHSSDVIADDSADLQAVSKPTLKSRLRAQMTRRNAKRAGIIAGSAMAVGGGLYVAKKQHDKYRARGLQLTRAD